MTTLSTTLDNKIKSLQDKVDVLVPPDWLEPFVLSADSPWDFSTYPEGVYDIYFMVQDLINNPNYTYITPLSTMLIQVSDTDAPYTQIPLSVPDYTKPISTLSILLTIFKTKTEVATNHEAGTGSAWAIQVFLRKSSERNAPGIN